MKTLFVNRECVGLEIDADELYNIRRALLYFEESWNGRIGKRALEIAESMPSTEYRDGKTRIK